MERFEWKTDPYDEEGLVITCKEGKLYIKLSDAMGNEIISDMDINITSATKVNIQGGEGGEDYCRE